MQKRLSKKFKSISYEAGRRSKKLFDFFKKDEKTESPQELNIIEKVAFEQKVDEIK